MDNYGILSLAPALVAVILAFITREALFSILCGVLVGLLVSGQDLLFGFTGIISIDHSAALKAVRLWCAIFSRFSLSLAHCSRLFSFVRRIAVSPLIVQFLEL